MLLDANLLLYAVDERSPFHTPAADWLTDVLNGDVAVGIPWQTLAAFVRISTHPRIMSNPLDGAAAWRHVDNWLDAAPVWIPPATESTARIYGELNGRVPITGNLVPDAMLAAQSIELGVVLMSVDTDFARFPGLRYTNPLVAG